MKARSIIALLLIAATATAFISSCDYFKHRGFKKTESGIYYKLDTPDNQDTTSVAVGKVVTMTMRYGLKDSLIFNSQSRPGEMRFMIPEPRYEGDFYEGLQLFNQGDSGTIILKAGPFFTQTIQRPTMPPGISDSAELLFDFYIQKVQTLQDVDAEIIRNFVAQKNITVFPDADGIYYIEKVKGTGVAPEPGNYATIHFTVSLLDGQQLFTTHESGEAIDFQVGSGFENPGFNKVVERMNVGGISEAVVPCAMAFGAQGIGQVVPPFTPLFYQIELIGTITKEQFEMKQAEEEAKQQAEQLKKDQEEMAGIQKFMKDNNIKATARPSGLVYVETLAGTGRIPGAGQKIKVHYTGKLINGTKFDSSFDRNEPIELTLGQGQVIPGWEEGLALMKEGGKATLIIPSKLGYGPTGFQNVIPPNATLIFDVELVQIVE